MRKLIRNEDRDVEANVLVGKLYGMLLSGNKARSSHCKSDDSFSKEHVEVVYGRVDEAVEQRLDAEISWFVWLLLYARAQLHALRVNRGGRPVPVRRGDATPPW